MEAGEDQTNSSSANSSAASGGNSRPTQIAQMSLYERQAVQALQALQRQPNAAQYFQQLMLQQQINSAQLHNLAAVQQATLAASRQSSSPSNSVSQATSTAQCTVNLSTTSGGGTMSNPRPIGPATLATSTALSQSVLLGGNSGGQGQMYLRVNRSLKTPLAPQLIFMPGGTATAAVATVAQPQPQQQPQQQQQQQETTPTSSSNQSDNDQVQNLAMRCVSTPRVATVKTEFADRKETSGSFPINQQPQTQQQFGQSAQQIQPQTQPLANTKLQNYSNTTNPNMSGLTVKGANQSAVTPQQAGGSSNPPSSSPSPSLPLSQLLLSQSGLCQARGVPAAAATVTHILVPTSNVPTSSQGYPMGTVATKSNMTAQTLVVQPLQQTGVNLSSDKLGHGTGHVPIQPKTAQGHRLPVQMPPRHPPPILPAPPNNGQATGGHHPPHVPVQLVGARQSTLGNSQALAVAQARACCAQQDATAVVPVNNSGSNVVTMMTAVETGGAGMCLKTAQSALPMSQMQTNQSAVLSQGNSAVTHSMDGQNNSGDSVFVQSGQAQTKPVIGPLKGKSESDLPHEMSTETINASPLMQDSAPPLSPAPSLDTVPEMAFSSPPTLSLSLPLPRGGGQGDRAPVPQAVVKPQVLTHLIEGFVIQEGAEPFPVTGPVKELPVAVPPILHRENIRSDKLKCEYCLRFAPANQFRRSKRFCSKTCAKRYNVSCSNHYRVSRGLEGAERPPGSPVVQDVIARRRGPRRSSSEIACAKIAGRHLPVKCRSESSRSEDISSCEEEEDFFSLSPSSSFSYPRPTHCGPQLDDTAPSDLPVDENHFLSGNPARWSVEEVCQFISSLQGCEDLASQFLSQEIDGQALLLLKEEHLMSTMNIKLGPALKICASINSLRD
ncbi:polyhomeotic-like protein 1 [Ctenopharyngodon idella]|uniref:polyhomeotic-like protein 1 n=1 Tax=Ctenopharyngodon idella TaxID=7959 RepID=UPI002231D401|nr:polyhomeotic-like protein 1 [Ctenopharyngodon idella]XP_051721779.1 polyhomeotic-like protein 1 [Ctenopharyngodon idella]